MNKSFDFVEQIRDETRMRHLGIKRYREKQIKAYEKERMSHVGAGAQVLASLVPQLTNRIKESLDLRRRRGPRPAWLEPLKSIEPEVAAVIALRTVMDRMASSREDTKQAIRVTRAIGSRIEDEVRMRWFKKHDPVSYANAMEEVSSSINYGFKRKKLMGLMKKCVNVPAFDEWKVKTVIRVGSHLLEMVVTGTHICEVVDGAAKHEKNRRNPKVVVPTLKYLDAVATQDGYLEELRPWYMPTATPPLPWDNPESGGYRTIDLTLVKNAMTQDVRMLPNVDSTPSQRVMRAVSMLQQTAWKVNTDVLAVIEALWNQPEAPLPNVPLREEIKLPPRPVEIPYQKKVADMTEVEAELLKGWKRAAAKSHEDEVYRRGKLLSFTSILVAARECAPLAEFYLPYQVDWRGRAYPVPLFLGPQGPDFARGLLQFAESKPLGTEAARRWFFVAGANHAGLDKLSFDDRVRWVEENKGTLLDIAADPLSNLSWQDMDEPYQFLAWVMEYGDYVDGGESLDFQSRHVIGQDGTCNGLQHLSAMMRDEVGGAAVNLVPGVEPADVYNEVCQVTEAKLAAIGKARDEEGRMARMWLNSGQLDRNLVKRLVMTLPYGATDRGMWNQLNEELKKREVKGIELNLDEFRGRAVGLLQRVVLDATGEVVIKAREVMDWMQECARRANDVGKAISWTTPHGFTVAQAYASWSSSQVETQLCGRVQLRMRTYSTTKLRKARQVFGIVPNFVHSLDACHLLETVLAMGEGVSWAPVHDSFGCHAADAERLALTLREEFIRLYEENDVVANLKAEMEAHLHFKLPAPPASGHLDIWKLLDSPYFFA